MLARSLALLAVFLVSCRALAADRTVYSCEFAGVTTYSDRPCGESITVYSLDSTAVPAPKEFKPRVATSPVEPPQRAARPARAPRAASSSKRQDPQARECLRWDAELRRLRSHMRAGYGVAEGERLRERQRMVKERRRERHCS
jgi:hypothetical protein